MAKQIQVGTDMDMIEREGSLQAMPSCMCPPRKASGGVWQGACYCSIVYSGSIHIFTNDLEQFGGISREYVGACFQRQTRRRNNKLGDGEIETTGRNYPNETFSLAKKKKKNVTEIREGGRKKITKTTGA